MKCTTCNRGSYQKKRAPYVFLGEKIGVGQEVILEPIDKQRLQVIVA